MKLALRHLAKSPGFTALVVLTLALGIGATVLTFSLVDALLLRPFPAVAPERLVALHEVSASGAFSAGVAISYSNFADWRRDNHTLAAAALYENAGYAVADGAASEHVSGANVTAGFFATFGIAPALGRGFTPLEESAAGPRVVVLSHDLWQRRYAADPAALGRTIRLDSEAYTIVGVMPPGFRYPGNAALWTPVHVTASADDRGTRSYDGVARLKPGVSVAQARADLNVVADRLAAAYPLTNALYGVQVEPFIASISAEFRRSVLTLFAAVGCLLLITCVNVASLLLARGAAREREIAVRLALGAGRARVVRQLLGESLLLGLAGGGLAVLIALWGVALLPRLLAPDAPYWLQFTLDGRVLAFSIAVTVVAALGFGLAPAWQLSRLSLNEVLKQSGRSGTVARTGLMRLLVGCELTLALVLLTGAGLLVKSFLRLHAVDPGFDPHSVLAFRLDLPAATYPGDAQQRDAAQQLVTRLQALPGVTSAALVSDLPLAHSNWGRGFTLAGRAPPAPGHIPHALNRVVSAGYFDAMRIPLKQGRGFDRRDTLASAPVAIVDETFVRRFFPGQDPVGQHVRYGGAQADNHNPWMEIVGVVGDVRHGDLQGSNPGPGLYVPLAQQAASYGAYYVLRTAGDPAALIDSARAAVAGLDAALAPEEMQPMTRLVRDASWRSRLLGGIFSAFAVLALGLAALGIYGVTAFATSHRTREFGVRLAVGAQPADILRLVLGGGLRLAFAALALGLVLAFGLTRFMAAQLYAVNPHDPLVFAGVALLLAATATLACLLPARRATRVDPVEALRTD
ncbi:MAG TPA: ABC transporter permease [Opitutus sp.]|nr:ABC transporter permease [Opitutus sp.]